MKKINFSYTENENVIVSAELSFDDSIITLIQPVINEFLNKIQCKCCCNCNENNEQELDCNQYNFNVTCQIPEYNSFDGEFYYPYNGVIKPIITVDNINNLVMDIKCLSLGNVVYDNNIPITTYTVNITDITNAFIGYNNLPIPLTNAILCDTVYLKLYNQCYSKEVIIKITGYEIINVNNIEHYKLTYIIN